MRILILIIAVTALLLACGKPTDVAQLRADGEKLVDQATPVAKDVVKVAAPIVKKGVEAAKAAYPSIKQRLEEGSNAISKGNIKEVITKNLPESDRAAEGPDVNGNLNYHLQD